MFEFEILESEQSKPFKVKGIAMIKNSLSANGRFYSDKLVEGVVKKVSSIIESNGSYPVTMMADHPGITANKTLSTVGRITAMYLEGDNAIIEAEIANTSLGKDVQELIRGRFVEGLSIRASKGKSRKVNINGKVVNDITEMELMGVDLVTTPGVKGARVTEILESDQTPSGLFVSIEEEEVLGEEKDPENVHEGDKTVDLLEAKLEDLKSTRPDLVESLKKELEVSFLESHKVNELTESVNTLTSDKDTLQGQLQESQDKVQTLEESVQDLTGKLEEAETQLKEIRESEQKAVREAHIVSKLGELKFADSVKDKLRSKLEVLESVEEIDAKLQEEVEYLTMIIKESTGIDVSGKGHAGENGQHANINEEKEFIKLVMES